MGQRTNSYITHHGIKGMKWGIRNADTLRRYSGGTKSPRKKASLLDRFRQKAKKPTRVNRQSTKSNVLSTRQSRPTSTASSADSQKSQDVERARKIALTTTSASELYKYSALLSDSELNARISRVNSLQNLQRMSATEKAANRSAVLKFMGEVGGSSAKSLANYALTKVGKRAIDSVLDR